MSWTKTSKSGETFTKAGTASSSFTSSSTAASTWSSQPNYTFNHNALDEYFDEWDGYFNLNEQYFGRSGLSKTILTAESWSKS